LSVTVKMRLTSLTPTWMVGVPESVFDPGPGAATAAA
jgi:hypothetical protein